MTAQSYQFGPFQLDKRERILLRDGQPISLRAKVFDTLCLLVENPGRLLTKEELLQAVWPDTVVEENNLNHNISVLRKALGEQFQKYIETVPKVGYRFTAEVKHAAAARPATRAAGAAETAVMVQRSADLEALQAAAHAAEAGRRQAVFVTGEAGAGKTTLLKAFLAELDAADAYIAQGQCVEYLTAGEPYMPFLETLGQLGRGAEGTALVDVLRRFAPTWLLHMPGLITAAEAEDIQRRLGAFTRERMLREMVDALESFAAQRFLVLVFEDLHWSDHSTVDLLARLARGAAPARLLLLCTYRPADAARDSHPIAALAQELGLRGGAQELPLAFLTEESIREYMDRRFGPGLPGTLAPLLYQRTTGNPLFVTTLVNAWVGKGDLRQSDGAWSLAADLEALAHDAPETLRQFIERQMALLSAEEQSGVEAAAVAGAEFSAALVAAGQEIPETQAEELCNALARRGQFFRRTGASEWPDGTVCDGFAFTHGLFQEVVYGRMAAGRRVRLHQQIGNRLETAFRGHEEEAALQLAFHFAEARDAARATRYLLLAAEHAMRRSAPREAITHLQKGMDMIRRFPELSERVERELELQAALAPALVVARGFADPEAEEAYRRAIELASVSKDPVRRFPLVFGLATMLELRGEFRASQQLMEEHLPAQERAGVFVVECRDLLACSRFHQGAFTDALEHGDKGIEAYSPSDPPGLNACFGENAGLGCYTWSALALWFLGFPEQALSRARRGRDGESAGAELQHVRHTRAAGHGAPAPAGAGGDAALGGSEHPGGGGTGDGLPRGSGQGAAGLGQRLPAARAVGAGRGPAGDHRLPHGRRRTRPALLPGAGRRRPAAARQRLGGAGGAGGGHGAGQDQPLVLLRGGAVALARRGPAGLGRGIRERGRRVVAGGHQGGARARLALAGVARGVQPG